MTSNNAVCDEHPFTNNIQIILNEINQQNKNRFSFVQSIFTKDHFGKLRDDFDNYFGQRDENVLTLGDFGWN